MSEKKISKDPQLLFATPAQFEKWLRAEHRRSPGLWVKLAKKGSGIASVTYAEALDVALCYGWIDGQKDKLDQDHWIQRFSPRRPKGRWSKINCARAEALIAGGKMQPAGEKEIDAAKNDGRWEAAYASQSKATVPEDLQTAIDANPKARAFFPTLDSANRYAILYRVDEAKKPETRAARVSKFVAMLAAHQTPYPPRTKKAR